MAVLTACSILHFLLDLLWMKSCQLGLIELMRLRNADAHGGSHELAVALL